MKSKKHSVVRSLVVVAFLATLDGFVGTRALAQSVPSNGLIGYWKGDGNALDSSPTGNNGSFGGSYAPGPFSGTSSFNLATGKVVIPDNSVYNFKNYSGWTVGFWFNQNGTAVGGGDDVFLGQDDGPGYNPKWFIDYGYTVYGNTSNFVWHVNDYNEERIFLGSNNVSFPSGWNQLTVVTGPSDIDFYLNGSLIGYDATPGYVLRANAPLILGYAESGLGYSGLMADVVLYNRALSGQEVEQLATPEPAPFAALGIGLLAPLVRRKRR